MITNGTATQENYYAVKFANTPLLFSYGPTALDAIKYAAADYTSEHRDTLGAAIARPAVYKEWVSETWRYTNGGDYLRGPRKVN
jgi:hypothetical protein